MRSSTDESLPRSRLIRTDPHCGVRPCFRLLAVSVTCCDATGRFTPTAAPGFTPTGVNTPTGQLSECGVKLTLSPRKDETSFPFTVVEPDPRNALSGASASANRKGHGSSHRGGHYHRTLTGNHYRRRR